MSWKEITAPVLTRMPTVQRPQGHIPFKRKVMWTGAVLLAYFTLTNILIFGLAGPEAGNDLFGQFRSILAGSQGSLLQLGIGPIVTASIVMQLLGGSDLLGLDTSNPRDQQIYQGLQKMLTLGMIFLTGVPLVFSGGFLPASPAIAQGLGIGIFGVQMLMFAQIAMGGVLVLYMDEIVSKWGIGSGIGLFIVAGVAQGLVGGIISQVIPGWISIATGSAGVDFLTANGIQNLFLGSGFLLPIITTVLIFVIVVYAESTRIEIPLSHSRVKGARGRFPVKLIYASVLPMILVRAVQANIQFLGRAVNANWANAPTWLVNYVDGQAVGGLFYYLAPIQSPGQWMWWAGSTSQEPWQILIRVAIDTGFMVFGGAVFAIYWVRSTGMGAESVAEQIQDGGMQIPGFRQNTSSMEKVLQRYIPYVTVIGGAVVGILAVGANMMGTIGGVSGTGLLLMVSITYKIYEELAEEMMMDNPLFRKLLGDG